MKRSVGPGPVFAWLSIGRGASILVASAPATLIVFWGLLVIVFLTQPIRPYTNGAWATGDLVVQAGLGGVLGLVSRPIPAAVGTIVGLAAAVALQLFVLAGQAHYQAVVVAELAEPQWTTAIAGAMAVALGAIASGYVVTHTALAVTRRRAHEPRLIVPTTSRPHARLDIEMAVASLAALSIAGLIVGTSLVTTARSAYLPSEDEPTIDIDLLDDGTLTVTPESVPAGRMTIVARGAPPLDHLSLVGPLLASVLEAPDVAAALNASRSDPGYGCCYWNHMLRRAELSEPGTYAFVAVDRDWEPPQDHAEWEAWDGAEPISDVHFLDVTEASGRPEPSTEAGGDGGAHLTVPSAAALGIEGFAAAGAVLLTVRGDRRRRARHLVGAIAVGVVSAAFVGSLTMLAISQAHSPF